MSVEFIGMIQSQKVSEIHPPSGPIVDPHYVAAFARAHEVAGFDRILVPHHSTGPSAPLTIAHAAAHTSRIGFLLAHRPGFVAPTLAAACHVLSPVGTEFPLGRLVTSHLLLQVSP